MNAQGPKNTLDTKPHRLTFGPTVPAGKSARCLDCGAAFRDAVEADFVKCSPSKSERRTYLCARHNDVHVEGDVFFWPDYAWRVVEIELTVGDPRVFQRYGKEEESP